MEKEEPMNANRPNARDFPAFGQCRIGSSILIRFCPLEIIGNSNPLLKTNHLCGLGVKPRKKPCLKGKTHRKGTGKPL